MSVTRGEQIAKGKTKTIFEHPNIPGFVYIDSNDDITAGDGERHLVIPGKGRFSTETAAHCFHALRRHEIPNHFIEVVGPATFRAHHAKMIPVEIVARRRATGSYLKRQPNVLEGLVFNDLVIEFFLKDDAAHDPFMICDTVGNRVLLYDAKKHLHEGFIREISPSGIFRDSSFFHGIMQLRAYAKRTFLAIEDQWQRLNVELIDLKIECGYNTAGDIIVADVITNDEWRIWPRGDKSQERSKQVFRDIATITPEDIEKIRSNYEWVARETAKFLERV